MSTSSSSEESRCNKLTIEDKNSHVNRSGNFKLPKPNVIKEYLFEALSVAHLAVQTDNSNEHSSKYEAQSLYQEAVQRFEHVAPFLPEGHSKILTKYSKVYMERSDSLEMDIPISTTPPNENQENSQSTLKFTPPSFVVPFTEEKIPEVPDLDPPPWAHRPFWLMKNLSDSMLKGAHLVPGLYIPKSVWFQTGAKLFAQQAKVTFAQNVSDLLRELGKVDINKHSVLIPELDKFLNKADKERELLMKQLPSANKQTETQTPNSGNKLLIGGKMFKSIYKSAVGLLGNTKKEETSERPYVPWLIALFDTCQFLDQWVTHFEGEYNSNKEIIERLEKIGIFFYYTVCSFVLQDLNILLERHMRKSRESFSRLFPKK